MVNCDNETISSLIITEGIELSELIAGGVKKDSALIKFVRKYYGELDLLKNTRMLLARIQSKKFSNTFNHKLEMTRQPTGQGSCAEALQTDYNPGNSCQSSHNFGHFSVKRKDIFSIGRELNEDGMYWTQRIYGSLPEMMCQIGIDSKYLSKNLLTIYGSCNAESCPVKFYLKANLENDADEELTFSITGNTLPEEEHHKNLKSRNISGQFRMELASQVNEFGAKNVENNLILSSVDLGQMNSKNQGIRKKIGCLRQMKHDLLAFSDMDSDNLIDILDLKKLTDNMPRSKIDPTPAYIRYIRADSLAVSWYCDTQLRCFLNNKDHIVSLDATGGITNSNGEGQQLYYAIVYRSNISKEVCFYRSSFFTRYHFSWLLGKFYKIWENFIFG